MVVPAKAGTQLSLIPARVEIRLIEEMNREWQGHFLLQAF